MSSSAMRRPRDVAQRAGPACPAAPARPPSREHGRRDVDEFCTGVSTRPRGRVAPGNFTTIGMCSERLVEHAAHVADVAVLAEQLAVVGGDDDERVLVPAARLERGDQLAERRVHRGDLAVVVGAVMNSSSSRREVLHLVRVEVLRRQPLRAAAAPTPSDRAAAAPATADAAPCSSGTRRPAGRPGAASSHASAGALMSCAVRNGFRQKPGSNVCCANAHDRRADPQQQPGRVLVALEALRQAEVAIEVGEVRDERRRSCSRGRAAPRRASSCRRRAG